MTQTRMNAAIIARANSSQKAVSILGGMHAPHGLPLSESIKFTKKLRGQEHPPVTRSWLFKEQ